MSSPSRASRRQSAARGVANDDADDGGLTRSLGQLSLMNQPAADDKAASAPLQPPSRLPSAAPPLSALPRLPSRSPSNGRDSGASRAATPPLLHKASITSLHSANGTAPVRSLSRRSTSSPHVMSPTSKTAPLAVPPQEDERPSVTANSVASSYFQAELEAHHGPMAVLPTKTIVVLNDAVYGHRYSRPRTSRSALGTIVERPERIKASVLGISAAYVRLGGRHSQGFLPVHPKRDVQTVPSIPFRIHKTSRRIPLASPAVTNVHGVKWMEELKLMCDSAESKLAMGGKELQRPEMDRSPDRGPPPKLHQGDLYLCSESLAAMEGALGAVCEAVDAVFTSGHRRAFVGVRPPGHHCSASHPSGFCWVNNVHIGIMHAALAHGLTHAAIIDFDLHHGDGSQAITWEHNTRAATASKNALAWKKTSIGYFSLHDINSYPCEMGDEDKVKNASLCIDNAHGQTVWNVHLHSWKTEQEFWRLYETKYYVLLEKTRVYLRNQAGRLRALRQVPKAAIFFSAGFDASEWESVGMQRHQVNVPTDFYARIAQDVVKIATEEGLYVDGRVISVLEGGYSDRALLSGIFSHLSGLVGNSTPEQTPQEAIEVACKDRSITPTQQYDPSWWASAELDKLERPPELPSPPRKPRNSTPPTYCSPTQASTAKVVDPAKMRRSLSGLCAGKVVDRPPSPPPPEVPWVVAAHELSKLLIPTGRQTDSCRPEDLNAEATKARRDRQSILMRNPPPAAEPSSRPTSRMALRERKSRAISSIDEEAAEQPPRARRKGGETPLTSPEKPSNRSTPSQPTLPQSSRRSSRRLSGVSLAHSPAKKDPSQAGSDNGFSRPASSMSPRAQSGDKLAVKKTRTSAGPPQRDAATKAPRSRSPRKAPTGAARNSRTQATVAQISRPPSTAPSATSTDMTDAMEGITTGMKKIKINLITQSQREAKERARLEAEKAAPTGQQQPPVNASSEVRVALPASDATVAAQAAEPLAADTPLPPGPGLETPVEGTCLSAVATPDARQVASPEISPDVPHAAAQPVNAGGNVFIPYQPEGPMPVAVAASQPEPLKWLPPNVPTPSANTPIAAPSPAKGQSHLFQYSSGIPFAPRAQNNTSQQAVGVSAAPAQEMKADDHEAASIWEVPETPRR